MLDDSNLRILLPLDVSSVCLTYGPLLWYGVVVVPLVVQVEEDSFLLLCCLVVGLGPGEQVVRALRHHHLQALDALKHPAKRHFVNIQFLRIKLQGD